VPDDRERTVPGSTYRVQLSARFTLDDLAAQVPYIARLGITHVYLSPIYRARPESPHGYDIVDYGCINRELGGMAAWRRLTETLRNHRIGVVLDVVPNHMAADPVNNALWRQVLRDGSASPAARFFDIDWRPLTGLVRDKVLLPMLEEPYGQALTKGAVQVEFEDNELRIRCGGVHLPLSPASVEQFERGQSLDEAIAHVNRNPDLLHQLLEQQHYRLAYWRPANDEINYRRFFGINELVATHAEDPEVFARSHELVLKLAAEGVLDGVRVDHVDGLLDPLGYLRQLRSELEAVSPAPPWLVVEKVLDPSERLGAHWPVDGTTGYDALDALNRLFVSGRGVKILRRFFQRLVGESIPFREEAHRSKRLMMRGALLSGVTILAHELKRVADASWTTRDIALNSLHEALVEFIAALPVYRTYLGTGDDRDTERAIVTESLELAEGRNPAMDSSAFAFLRSLLLGELVDDPALAARRATLVKRLQQYTSGVYAKGVEDTAFYRDNTLLALNEVGGNPANPSLTIREFHHFNEQRAKAWPNSMTATSTHDTKLSEDTRMRIASLSVFAREWAETVRRWMSLNAPYRRGSRRGSSSPDVRDEYRFYQVLVGTWTDRDVDDHGHATAELVERLVAYMRKAAREAQLCTSWMRPDAEYEDALESFVRRVLTEDESAEFRESVGHFVNLIQPLSTCHSISQLVLKCFMPGVPDFYQGCEDWRLTLTDPDNRRPIDFACASERLTQLFQSRPTSLHGNQKLQIASTLLQFRSDHAGMLREAAYRPLRVRGSRAASVVTFERRGPGSRVVVAVPRLTARVATIVDVLNPEWWGDTAIRMPSFDGRWSNLLAADELVIGSGWCRMAELTTAQPWVVLYHARLKPGRSRSL
jgi:(1->4)-alpha-D-glucan 1-alpha-D-glucosylmutase